MRVRGWGREVYSGFVLEYFNLRHMLLSSFQLQNMENLVCCCESVDCCNLHPYSVVSESLALY